MFSILSITIEKMVRNGMGAYSADPYRTNEISSLVRYQVIYSCTVLNLF